MDIKDKGGCQRCNSERVFHITVISRDPGRVPIDWGLVPNWDNNGDFLEISYCFDCGQIQGKFPLPITEYEKYEKEEPELRMKKAINSIANREPKTFKQGSK